MADAVVHEGLMVAIRFALYVALGAAFGLAVFDVAARPAGAAGRSMRRRHRAVVAWLAAVALVMSAVGMVVLAEAMSGAARLADVSGHVVGMVVSGTPAGFAWIVRSVALVGCIGLAGLGGAGPGSAIGLTAASAVALASLAWSGHGAMDGGARGVVHLASDVAHLWAAGAWFGALVGFLLLASMRRPTRDDLGLLGATTRGFARTGTVIVAVLALTGLANYLLIVGPAVAGLVSTLYGRLLIAKLALFGGMLALAAANRFRLGPRLTGARAHGDRVVAAKVLRSSLAAETALALGVLAAVAWLGVQSPAGH